MNVSPASPAIVYGIASCDTVKKARAWLTAQGLQHSFHDFKKTGVPAELPAWVAALGWQALLNRRGTTWRALPHGEQAAVVDADAAMVLMRTQPSVMKRPVVRWADGEVTVGFDAAQWADRARGEG